MGTHFTKRPRPTPDDLARERRAGLSIHRPADHAVTLEERLRDTGAAHERVRDLLKTHFSGNVSLDLTILRGHLVLELVLNHAIRFLTPVQGDPERLRLIFPQKLELLHLLGAPSDAAMFVTLELWNQLRNQLAHRFTYDRGLVDRIIDVNSEVPQGDLSDSKRARRLRSIGGFYAGAILGGVEGISVARAAPDPGSAPVGRLTRG